MTGEHYEDYELLAYDERDGEMIDLDAADRHIAVCEECAERRRRLRVFQAFLRDRSVHDHARRSGIDFHDGDDLARNESERRRDEEEAAAVILALRQFPIAKWSAWLSERQANTRGMVHALLSESRRHLNDRPAAALRIIDIAENAANAQVNVFDRAECRGNVELQRANALRHMGKYDEALRAADSANELLAELPAPTYDLAFATWAKANVLFSMTRFTEALLLARDAEATFAIFGDTANAQRARVLVASVLCEEGELETATTMYHELRVAFERAGDREMVARVTANLADCAVRTDDFAQARLLGRQATHLYTDLGRPSEATRVRWSLGHALLRKGELESAMTELLAVARDYERRGMLASMGEVFLDLVEVYLRRDEWEQAEALAAKAAAFLGSAPVHLAQAYAYLRDAVASRTATLELIESVRAFGARKDGSLTFQPPSA
jgi:tetratricopeptide (TPR) repeat protein